MAQASQGLTKASQGQGLVHQRFKFRPFRGFLRPLTTIEWFKPAPERLWPAPDKPHPAPRRTDGWTDGRTYRFPLCSTGLHPPSGPKPKKENDDC